MSTVEAPSVDVPVDDLETVTMTRADLRAHEERIRNRVWKEARLQFGKRASSDALTTRVEQLEAFVLKLSTRILDRIEGPGPSDQPAAEKEH